MTTLGAETIVYDGADRHVASTANNATVRYTRDATGAIVARTVSAIPAFRARTSTNNGGASTTSIVLTRPASTQTGDVLVAVVSGDFTAAAPTGWTTVATAAQAGAVTTRVRTHVADPADPSSWTFTWTGSKKAMGGIAAYSGIDTTNPVDVSATQLKTGNGTSHPAASVTTTIASTILVTAYGLKAGTSVTRRRSGPTDACSP